MLSNVYSVGNKLPVQTWNLEEQLGLGFEKFVYDMLCDELNSYFKLGLRIYKTSSTRDDGKDIIINSPIDLCGILNRNFKVNEEGNMTIYIECKSSNDKRISFDKIIGNIEKIKEYNVDYFVLVTNTTITPYTYYKLKNSLSEQNIKFALIDQYYFAKLLLEKSKKIGNMIDISKLPDLYAEYQILDGIDNGQNIYNIYIVIKNFTNKENLCSLNLLTDRNWHSSKDSYSRILDAYESIAIKLTITRNYSDGIKDLLFNLRLGENESQLHIRGKDVELDFEPSFIGEERYKCLQELKEEIENSKFVRVHYIFGEAGIGKTRLISELYKETCGTNIDFGFFVANENYPELVIKVQEFLENKGYLKSSQRFNSLLQCVNNSMHSYRRAVLFFDDCHNASCDFLNAIKSINSNDNYPISIVVCGRNDYSVGDFQFYSFINWCIENTCIKGWILKPLKDQETQNLIKSIINNVPIIILDKIHSMSQNNPLYIVQLIEYFLELNIVEIVNRNTVGIIDPAIFSSKLYIPKAIHNIYQKRIEHLLKLENGDLYLNFLFFLCIINGCMDIETAYLYFSEQNVIENLIGRHLIKLGNDGNVRFVHESFLLFIERYLESSEYLMKQTACLVFEKYNVLLDFISNKEKGKLALWYGHTNSAKGYFRELVKAIKSINNVSSYNINTEDYKYLIWIFKLYQNDDSEEELLKKILISKIYTSLHYFSPVKAIIDCDEAIKLIEETPLIKNDNAFRNTILEQKAHSLFNAGRLSDGELLMKQIEAQWLLNRKSLSPATTFDMFDRLSGIYIKYNCWQIAAYYNKLSFKIARSINDKKLLAIASLTKNKLYLYKNKKITKDSLDFVDNTHKDGSSRRILCSNKISALIFNILYEHPINWKEIFDAALDCLLVAIKNDFATSVIRSYLILAVSSMYLDEPSTNYRRSKEFIDKGINVCIQFGNSVHIWQFYNLWAIIETKLNSEPDYIKRLFETVFTILSKQNLLYLGNLDLSYGNVFAISNYGFCLQSFDFETEFYRKMSQVSYVGNTLKCDYNCSKPSCGFVCQNTTEVLKQEYQNAQKRKLLFVSNKKPICLQDDETGYFIVIS